MATTKTSDLARLLERIRGRVRRGASERHSLAWWWLWERQAEVPALLVRHSDQCWRVLADTLGELGIGISPSDLRQTWEQVQDQAPAEREKMDKASAKRRHAKAWKVAGKLPRNPVVAAEREERLAERRANLAKWKREREERAEASKRWPSPIVPKPPPPPPPPSAEELERQEKAQAMLERLFGGRRAA